MSKIKNRFSKKPYDINKSLAVTKKEDSDEVHSQPRSTNSKRSVAFGLLE